MSDGSPSRAPVDTRVPRRRAARREKAAALGPDPLREDADAEVLWAKVQTSKKPIGLVLMDQTMIAGLGNIYRAEVLFKVPPWPDAACARQCSCVPAQIAGLSRLRGISDVLGRNREIC